MRWFAFPLCVLLPLHAAVIGVSKPTPGLTEARIKALPAAERGPWEAYLRASADQMRADKQALAAERAGLAQLPALPKTVSSARSIPLDRPSEFYRSAEARHIGDVIVSFQTPAGGWSKNLDMGGSLRQRGQMYAAANLPPTAVPEGDFDKPRDELWHYIGTLDNDATNTELHFLAKLAAAFPAIDGDAYRASILRGVEYLLRAQFPNGGWPQVWPLEGGYHDAVTFNDDAVTESAETLSSVAGAGEGHVDHDPAPEVYTFVPTSLRARAKTAVDNALQCILRSQLRVPSATGNGTVLAVWAQQYDPLTLQPVTARNFEPEALASGESASIMEYLMSVDHPSPAVVTAVQAAAAWFQAHQITGYTWTGGRGTPGGRALAAKAGAGPLWARFYSLTTGRPIFGDRDKTIHDDVMELSLERRNGYAWYGEAPAHALAQYAIWKQQHPAQ